MRYFWTIVILVVLLEVLLGLAFWAGYAWIGGWWWYWGYWWIPAEVSGVELALLVLVLLLLPWLGELRCEYDSAAGLLHLEAGWLFGMRMLSKPPRETRWRALFIRWRTRPRAKPDEPPPAETAAPTPKPARPRRRRRGFSLRGVSPEETTALLLSGLQALQEFTWGAREMSLRVQAPTQIPAADTAIAGVVGSRRVGPLQLSAAGSGERAVQVRYRLSMFRVLVAGLYVLAQGRPWRLRRRRVPTAATPAAEAAATPSKEAD